MYIYGASGHAKVVIDSIVSMNDSIEGIYDDNPRITSLVSYEVVSPFQSHLLPQNCKLVIAIGDNKVRRKLAESLHVNYGNAIHSSSIISHSTKLGEGIAIMANTVINAESVIGNHVIINTSTSIDHDCVIGDYAHIAPNVTLCGGITIGEGSLIGVGAIVLPNIKIGKWVTVGAGSVVTKNIADNSTVIGSPAKQIIK